MFASPIFDVIIGLAFVFLLMSLIVTAIHEFLATIVRMRGSMLAKGISKLLADPGAAEAFFSHPMIRSLSSPKLWGHADNRPSYIPSRTFAATVLDILSQAKTTGERTIADVTRAIDGLGNEHLKRTLTVLLEEGQHDLEKFEEQLEIWFNNHMDRVSGWYKRRVQWVLLVIAGLLSVAINADSVAITRQL